MIAEGVETAAQVALLRVAGAGHMQGYYFSRPVTVDVAREIAAERFIRDPSEIDEELGTGTDG